MASTDKRDEAAAELGYAAGITAGPLGFPAATWERYADHVKAAKLPHPDKPETWQEEGTPQVPLLVYGDGPHDYISTDFDAGQVMIRDGNDPSGKAHLFPEGAFYRFAAKLRGERLKDDEAEGDNPIEAAKKLQERTAAKVKADQQATADNKADRP